MIRLIQRRLIIPRGDTGSFSLPVISSLNIGDIAVFTIFDYKRHVKVYQKIVNPENDVIVIRFEHEDTVNLPIGKYYWDVKFYQNPVFLDEQLVDGTEVDSYYAAFGLPECEIRQTGDSLLTADDSPTSTLSPDTLNYVQAMVTTINQAADNANRDAELAEGYKDSAAQSAEDAGNSAQIALDAQTAAETARTYTEDYATTAAAKAAEAVQSANAALAYKNAAAESASFADTDAISANSNALKAEGFAIGEQNGNIVTSDSPYYNNNSKYYANLAQNYADNTAQDSNTASSAATSAQLSATNAHNSEVAAANSEATTLGYLNQITGLTATASQLSSTASPTASYNSSTGTLSLGIPEGVGITSITLNNDYTLTINLNNGQSVTTTSIRGPQGPQGDAFHIVKTYASIAAMNADYSGTDVKIGEFVMIVSTVDDPDNAKVYVKGDQQYNFVVDMSGSTGIEGPEGKGINSVSIAYQGSASNTSAPTGTWVDNPPSVVAGEYLWTRIIFTYTDSTTSAPFYSVAKQGDTGLRGSTWYNGTAITGTNTTPQIFVNSNITDAVVGDMYLNIETSNTYRCTLAGDATVAKWAYVNNIKGGQGDPGPVGSEYTVLVQESQPTETSNKLWIPNGNNGITQEVPTVSEMNAALAGKADTSDIKVQDVQVNGVSILSNGVANVPVADAANPGVVKVSATYGLDVGSTGQHVGYIRIVPAPTNRIKNGDGYYNPVTTNIQHASTFYGLAKAAGDTTQSQSDNAVGTYTDAAKTAIKNMLGVNVDDVQVNGTSIVSNGVANVPVANADNYGTVKVGNGSLGIQLRDNGQLQIAYAGQSYIKLGSEARQPIVPFMQHVSTFYGLAKAAGDTTMSSSSNAVGTYTDNAKASIKSMLGIVDGSTGTVDVTGTTPTITAVENTRYVCGEVATLDITPPVSGICIVRFTSGTTATVLTATGVVWPEWFDDTALEASRVYEICITDGYGAVMSWAL